MGLKANADNLLQAKESARSDRRCKAVSVVDALPAGDRELYFARLLPDVETYSAGELASLLEMEGLTISPSTIAMHRGRRCRCPQ